MTKFVVRWVGRFTAGMLGIGGFAVANAMVGWWRIGPQSSVPAGTQADYAVQPPHIPGWVEAFAGVSGLLIAGLAVAVLLWATATRRISRLWWLVVPAVALAGWTTALIGRTVTAAVVGANIGAGLAVFVLGPLVVALFLWSASWTSVLINRAATQDNPAVPYGSVRAPRRYAAAVA